MRKCLGLEPAGRKLMMAPMRLIEQKEEESRIISAKSQLPQRNKRTDKTVATILTIELNLIYELESKGIEICTNGGRLQKTTTTIY